MSFCSKSSAVGNIVKGLKVSTFVIDHKLKSPALRVLNRNHYTELRIEVDDSYFEMRQCIRKSKSIHPSHKNSSNE